MTVVNEVGDKWDDNR